MDPPDVTRPVSDVARPVSDVTWPVSDITWPVSDVAQPAFDVTRPVSDVTRPMEPPDVTWPVSDVSDALRGRSRRVAPGDVARPSVRVSSDSLCANRRSKATTHSAPSRNSNVTVSNCAGVKSGNTPSYDRHCTSPCSLDTDRAGM